MSLRNVGICAHIDAGKTTLTERILHLTGVERHVGRVDEGTSVMDWMSEERERGITITAAATRVQWEGTDINLVDTPGHVDFTVEVERCMRVLDGAILVLDATKGVEPQTETVWRQVERRGLPAIAFANKCERPGADVLGCAASIEARLGRRPLVVAYPIGGGDTEEPLAGIVDLVHMRAFGLEPGGKARPIELPAGIADEAGVLRAELIEALGDLDETMFGIVCDGREPTEEEVQRSLRTLVRAKSIIPVLCGAALLGHGVPMLLDAVAALLPSPLEALAPELFHAGTADRDLGARYLGPLPEPLLLSFKVHSKLRRGVRSDLNFVRIYAGEVRAGTRLWNGRTRHTEEVQSVLRIHASDVEHIEVAGAGDVVALAGLQATGSGDTLTEEGSPVRLEPPRVPTPVLGVLVEPITDDERPALQEALEQLSREDPSLFVSEEPASGQWLLEGMGELHLNIALARLDAEFSVKPRVGPPRVALRESVRAAARGEGAVDRAFGEVRAAVSVHLAVDPLDDPAETPAISFAADVLEEGLLDAEARRAITWPLRAEAGSGPLAGHPLVGVSLRVVAVKSSVGAAAPGVAWSQAAVAALRDAARAVAAAGGVKMMEPWMAFVVDVPVDVSSGVIGDLNSRRATMDEILSTGTEARRVTGSAPLGALIGYSTDLRSLSKGRATFSLRPRGLDFAMEP